jgi:DNA-binding response OmpR family regulator
MVRSHDRRRAITLLKRLARILRLAAKCAAELQEVLIDWGEFNDVGGALANLLGTQLDDPAELYDKPIMNDGPRTITWQGRTCRLGPLVLFRLMARLAQHPGEVVPFDRLKTEAWRCRVSPDAIRAGVCRLRRRLTNAGMGDLAEAIRSERKSYYLDLNGSS